MVPPVIRWIEEPGEKSWLFLVTPPSAKYWPLPSTRPRSWQHAAVSAGWPHGGGCGILLGEGHASGRRV